MRAFFCRSVCLLIIVGSQIAAQEPTTARSVQGQVIPEGTQPLLMEGDLASEMVAGIDRFLLSQIRLTAATRPERFVIDTSSPEKFADSLKPHRQQLARAIGAVDPLLANTQPEIVRPINQAQPIITHDAFTLEAIRWPVLGDPSPQVKELASLWGEGLLLTPTGTIKATVIVLTDCDETPERFCGLVQGGPARHPILDHLVLRGCRVVVPQLVSRTRSKRLGRADLTHREYLHRPAFLLGRTLAGYEVQSVRALLAWYQQSEPKVPIGLAGYGEGGMLALFTAALEPGVSATLVSGFFGAREQSWQEPLDRNFFGLLKNAGASELALMVAPRALIIETARGPELTLAGNGGAPAQLASPEPKLARSLVDDAIRRLKQIPNKFPVVNATGANYFWADAANEFSRGLGLAQPPEGFSIAGNINVSSTSGKPDLARQSQEREQRLIKQIDRHTQRLLDESPQARKEFMKKLDTSSLAAYEKSVEPYRALFRQEVIGSFDIPLSPANPRSRKKWDNPKWTGYEVVLDVFPDVIAYGVLLIPKDLKPGERRPVVVCQHGLEGRPTDVFLNNNPAYHDFAAKLCERGFVTFAPQNPYIFTDRFRTLQRKAQPLGKSLFSIIVPQHQQIVNWLKTQSFVDPQQIAFYGLSYGGKSAMRIPALVTDYCLSICSADFNEWVVKNASTRHHFSYVWTGEYEIFEWNLGNTFNYAEMAALICPRPFMVERGHFDGVGDDEWVAFEYAKVRNLYAAKLKIPERTEIEWFAGPHTINGQGTYRFLQKHLKMPNAASK